MARADVLGLVLEQALVLIPQLGRQGPQVVCRGCIVAKCVEVSLGGSPAGQHGLREARVHRLGPHTCCPPAGGRTKPGPLRNGSVARAHVRRVSAT